MSTKVLVITPAYNEASNISKVVDQVQRNLSDLDVEFEHLIVNDNSADETPQVVKEKEASLVSHLVNLGGGTAMKTGFKYAMRHDFDAALQIDGDGQHDPEHVERVLHPVIHEDIDLCIGSRFIDEPGYKVPFIRKVGIKFYALVVSLLIGKRVTDCNSGYRAYSRKLLNHFSENYPDGLCTIESEIWAGRRDFRVKEVPISMSERQEGKSYLNFYRMAKYPFKMLYSILRAL